MGGYSLRRRLLLLAALWMAAAIIILGSGLTSLLSRSVEQGLQTRLEADTSRLIAAFETGGMNDWAAGLPEARYGVPASGYYWQVTDVTTGDVERSRSLWNATIPSGAGDAGNGPAFQEVSGPNDEKLLALTRRIRLATAAGEKDFMVMVAEARDLSVGRFSRDMAVALLFLFVAGLGATASQMYLVLKPLRGLRVEVEKLRQNDSTGIHGDFPEELQPLVRELNDLLVGRENSVQFARARAADLAHGLKTPLSVFFSIADELDRRGDRQTAVSIRDLSNEISERIDYQLQLARLRLRSKSHVMCSSLNAALAGSISVLQRTREGERLDWRLDAGIEVHVDVDRHDLVELLGTLLENACAWASSQVEVRVSADAAVATTYIADDGPGVSDEHLSTLGCRGRRLDESRGGSGMGLSIAREIATLNGGNLSFGRARLGGMLVTLSLPVSHARSEGGQAQDGP